MTNNQSNEPENREQPKWGYIKVQLDYAPTDSEEAFAEWCKKHGFYCFGLDVGRRAWCSSLSTYLRDAAGIAYNDGEPLLFYEEDVLDEQALINQQIKSVLDELEGEAEAFERTSKKRDGLTHFAVPLSAIQKIRSRYE